MLIKAFCEATGLPRDTVRFYVRLGLLRPDVGSRPGNRYQVFSFDDVERARLIRAGQALGFTLRELAAFGEAYEKAGLDAPAKAKLLRERMEALDEQARRIGELRDYLAAKLAWVEAGERGAAPTLKPSSRRKRTSAPHRRPAAA